MSKEYAQGFADAISSLVLHHNCPECDDLPGSTERIANDVAYILSLPQDQLAELLELANTHHVLNRLLIALKEFAGPETPEWCRERLQAESARAAELLGHLEPIREGLEVQAGKTVVIKSLDHWPDVGSDLDLYTSADESRVIKVMREQFNATPVERSWGDRLGNKWNFSVPGLADLVEIHVRYLGQTGEHADLAKRVVERRLTRNIQGHTFYVPAPEERILISTLQRMYRHFYFRLCDMVDVATLLHLRSVDFTELQRAAESAGIWPGVEAFLLLVHKYVTSFGLRLELPAHILASKNFYGVSVRFGNGFLRVPKLPAAGLYGKQLVNAGVQRDLRAMLRLPLLPPLAISALFAYRLTGSDKGVW